MFPVARGKILAYGAPMDMRRGIDGLAMIVAHHFHSSPQQGGLYIFINRRQDKLKILYWDRNGFCLWYKRLEKGTFKISFDQPPLLTLTPCQLRRLLEGVDYRKTQSHLGLNYQNYF